MQEYDLDTGLGLVPRDAGVVVLVLLAGANVFKKTTLC